MIQHVALETARSEGQAAVGFWQLLGFEPVDPPPSLSDRAAWLEKDGTQVHLLWADAPVAAPEGHVALVVEGYEEALDALRSAGIEVEPRAEHWGAPRSFVRAPGGHRVELMAAPPPPGLLRGANA